MSIVWCESLKLILSICILVSQFLPSMQNFGFILEEENSYRFDHYSKEGRNGKGMDRKGIGKENRRKMEEKGRGKE